jgi:hypothetical protein
VGGKEHLHHDQPEEGRAGVHLGMTLDWSRGKVKIDMTEYLQKKVLDEIPKDMDGTTSSAAAHLFRNRRIELLDKTKVSSSIPPS